MFAKVSAKDVLHPELICIGNCYYRKNSTYFNVDSDNLTKAEVGVRESLSSPTIEGKIK